MYQWLKSKASGFLVNAIKWYCFAFESWLLHTTDVVNRNYTKFLVDRDGVPVKRYSPRDAPSSIEGDIE